MKIIGLNNLKNFGSQQNVVEWLEMKFSHSLQVAIAI
jgi:hypothetical protein